MQWVKMAKTNQYVQGMGSLCSEVQAGWQTEQSTVCKAGGAANVDAASSATT